MELETAVKVIGCLVIAANIFAIPCLVTLAFALNWDVFLKYILTILSIGVIIGIASSLYREID